ncbi:MAG: NAD-dependent epimerase/dehydratase family protein [Betaproteobacteria bacterium]
MNLLLLGGTRFLGRHMVDAALARGHHVTTFTRGRSAAAQAGVDALTGDRDPRVGDSLAALERRAFDAVVDLSGYVPRVVQASAQLLRDAVPHYVFVSSVSVYADVSKPGVDEDAPLAVLADAASEDVLREYGALKAACERAVGDVYGGDATMVRPGLIVGPFDPTDRFAYWVARFVHPALLGERGTRAVVPAPPARPIQLIDARDLAAWIVDIVELRVHGRFNAVSANGRWSFGDLVDALIAASPDAPQPAWVDDATLQRHGVEPWVGLPLWLPATEADHAGFMCIDARRAIAAGLHARALAATIADFARWLATRDNAGAWKMTLSARREAGILG